MKLDGHPLTVVLVGSMTGLPPAKLVGTVDLSVPSVRGLAKWGGSALPPGGLREIVDQGKNRLGGPQDRLHGRGGRHRRDHGPGVARSRYLGSPTAAQGDARGRQARREPLFAARSNFGRQPAGGSGRGRKPCRSVRGLERCADRPRRARRRRCRLRSQGRLDLVSQDRSWPQRAQHRSEEREAHSEFEPAFTLSGARAGKDRGRRERRHAVFGADLALSGVQVEPLLAAAASTDRLSGTAKIRLRSPVWARASAR